MCLRLRFFALLACAAVPGSRAEEGLWTFEAPPREQLKERFQFEPDDAWLEHLRLSTIRFGGAWGSAAFVSTDGLVITDHHVGWETIERLITSERNLLVRGFVARNRTDEIPCPGLELSVLQSSEDVTARVQTAVAGEKEAVTAAEARQRAIFKLEQQSREATGLRSEIVRLHQGGQFQLQRYRVCTDIRLVFAPEAILQEIGDPRRTEDPRLKFDVALFRAYENGRPVQLRHYLHWAKSDAAVGDLTFLAGYPTRSQRFLAVAELAYLRDSLYPHQIRQFQRDETMLRRWAALSAENAKRAEDLIARAQGLKQNRERRRAILADPAVWAVKRRAEEELRQGLAAVPEKNAAVRRAFERLEEGQKAIAALAPRYGLLEEAEGFGAAFTLARLLLRASVETTNPDGARLPEFTEAVRPALERQLFTAQPLYAELECARLADALQSLGDLLGAEDPLVVKVLAGKSPAARAAEVMAGTKVLDWAARRSLFAGGAAVIEKAQDPLIEVARLIDPAARAVRREFEAAEELKTQAYAGITPARRAFVGSAFYPDATHSLRLSFGVVKHFGDFGQKITGRSDFANLFAHSEAEQNRPPFELPESWRRARSRLNLDAPLNFVTGHDTLAGSSGSPLVNRAGEFVGLLFGAVRWGVVGDFVHDERVRGDIHVHGSAILEVLEKVYEAPALAGELRTGKR